MHSRVILTAIAMTAALAVAARVTAAESPAPAATPSPATSSTYPCNNINAYVTRPTIATSVCAVQPGQIVIETGYMNTATTGTGANSTATYPQALVKTGIGPRIEFDLTPPSVVNTNNGVATISGTSDLGLGVKAVLGYSSRALYGIGASMTVPTGSAAFTNGANTYSLILNGTYSLTSALSLFSTLGYSSLVGTDANGKLARFGSFIPSAGVSYSLPSNWYAFVEAANFGKLGPTGGSRTIIDYGIEKVVGRTQFDAEVGNALNVVNGSRFHYVGAGVSVLIGKS
jgi:hypothetical protein